MSNKSSKDEIETSQKALDSIAGYSGAVVSTSKFPVEADLDCENVELKKSINEESSTIKKLQYKIRSLNHVLTYEKLGNYNLWKGLSTERQTILELNRNTDDLKNELQDASNGLQDARKEASAKVCELQKELSENHAKVVDMEGEIENLKAEIVDVTSRNRKLMFENQSISASFGDFQTGLENICTTSIKSFEKTGVNITPETHKTLKDYFEKNFQEKTNGNDHSIPGSSHVDDEDCSSQRTSQTTSSEGVQYEASEDNNSEVFALIRSETPDLLEVDRRLNGDTLFNPTGMRLRSSSGSSAVATTKMNESTDSVDLTTDVSKVHYSQSSQIQSNSNVDNTGEKLGFSRRKSKRRSKGSPCFYPPSAFENGRKSKRSKMRKTTWSHYQEIPPVWQIPQSTVKAECEKDDGTTQGEESTDINAV